MSVECIFKKVIRVPIQEHLGICILSISIFSTLVPQLSHGQEADTIAGTPINLQQENTTVENRDKLDAIDSHSSTITKRVEKIVKQRGFKKTISHTPVFDKSGNIYLASCDGKLSAIDPAGNTKWYIQLADKINTDLAISLDNTLYFSSEKTLYAIGSDGVLKWVFNADNTIDFPSVLDNQGNVYIVTKKDDYLYAIRPDGGLYWKAHINGHISTPPSVTADSNIYITTKDNKLYAINADGSLRWRRKIYCRQADQPTSVVKMANIVSQNSTLQATIKPIHESQALRISHIKPEEIQTSSNETDKPANTSFTASTVTGASPLTIKFSDNSTGKIIGRCWDFGDGTPIISEPYPVHTYTAPGEYNVRLIIGRPDNTSTIIRQRYITVIDTFPNSSKESMTDKQGKNNTMPSMHTPISNIDKDTKLSNSDTLVSIANSKEP